MSENIITCPYCGYVATEGEFAKNEGCPVNTCKAHGNMKKYLLSGENALAR